MQIKCNDGILKFDEGKLDLRLVEPWVVEELCRVYMYGVHKYHEGSWKKFTPEEARKVFESAYQRHANALRKGEIVDPETGLKHSFQAAWNLITWQWYIDHEAAE